ncbi:MAG: tRNA 2-thiouridine(34) synthase MnmA, partial [Legionellales bacterium]|nr:tRNA 2-thiouridine(34) synthase MnmA [Legionellales bacterium]
MKIIVGMSGGVDSSVAALNLVNKHYEVVGLFMKNWEDDDDYCTSEKDFSDALRVCQKLNIPLKTVNFSKEYKDKVFKTILEQFHQGLTPNPDILCNQEIKFKCFFDKAIQMGADYIATGHYATIKHIDHNFYLCRSRDINKDQTYFLYRISQNILSKLIFPIGNMLKQEVRTMAKDHNLNNFDKKDSTGICFIGERNFKDFLSSYILKNPGDIVDDKGKILGQHDGLMFYTIGQRSGLNIGGLKNYPEKPWYVLQKKINENKLIVGQDHNHPLLMQNQLVCTNLHWITP